MPSASGRPATALASEQPTKTHAGTGTLAKARAAAGASWLSAALGVVVLLVASFQFIVQDDFAATFQLPVVRLAILAVVLTGAGLYAVQHFSLVDESTFRILASAFGVIVALALALVETSVPLATDHPVSGVSAVAPWILLLSVAIPRTPVATLVAGLAAAAMWPAAYAINVDARGFAPVPWDRLIVWPGINVLTAVLAALLRRRLDGPSHVRDLTASLGSYRLISPIGEGGMGEVWKASHEMLARRAAIKLVRPNVGAFTKQPTVWVERFRREANVIASLQSPHTIYLYDFGLSGDGQFYYVMELVDGISLQTLVATFGPQPAARVRSILIQICSSLEEAHERGVIHRDLKPSNVMICQLALDHDFVKVLDFGLAKCASCEDLGAALTVEGTTAGTPGYIAPEVALGELNVDARADVYALGCVAYFLLTGTLVFPDSNPMSMALKHVQATPDLPSSRTELPIPAELEDLVMRCLAKRPDERPSSVREITDTLRAQKFAVWMEEDAAEWWRRHLPRSSSLRAAWDETGTAI
jgi:eukaryotic-like serine/threonine-protein kinase